MTTANAEATRVFLQYIGSALRKIYIAKVTSDDAEFTSEYRLTVKHDEERWVDINPNRTSVRGIKQPESATVTITQYDSKNSIERYS